MPALVARPPLGGEPGGIRPVSARMSELLDAIARLVPAWAANAATLDEAALPPVAELAALREVGALRAPAPHRFGGLGLGTEPAGAGGLARLLRLIGQGNLALGRIFEGHVNALQLVTLYGTPDQTRRAAEDARAGHLFAIWATEAVPVRLTGTRMLQGEKLFCSAAALASRALITVTAPDGPRLAMIALEPGSRVHGAPADTHGMRACGTASVDFSGVALTGEDLVGAPGDYLRQPAFSAGAWRASAVALGGLDALVAETARQLVARNRHTNPHQQARLGELAIRRETAALWVAKAARIAEAGTGDPGDTAQYVNLARIAVESACLDAMRLSQRALGLAAFVRPNPVERLLRDLATYLRQPAPDETLTEAGAWFATRPPPE